VVRLWRLAAALGAVAAIAGAAGIAADAAPDDRRPAIAAAGESAGGWRWPLRPAPDRVVRDFDPPAEPWLAGNRGVDLAGRAGQPVHAAGAGLVSFAWQIAGVGVVSVTSGSLRTTYEPLRLAVHRGDAVRAGTVLGRLALAGSHCLPDACLHWGLLRGAAYLDPLALLGLEQVRLLPDPPSG